jgi:alkylation response protein AidB-like acyl-CoA dehydrogenase
VSRLDVLADAGLYGLAGPKDTGGMGIALPAAWSAVETIAGGCLTTAFVWSQHHGLVAALSAEDAPVHLRDAWLGPLCRGDRRAGVSFAGLLPGTPLLRARAVPGGWIFDGAAPWVTGWGRIDVVHVAARTADDPETGGTIVRAIVDARTGPTLTAEPLRLVAVNASGTVTLGFHEHIVAAERVTGTEPYGQWRARDPLALRLNGSFALGVGGRCLRLLGPTGLDDELEAVRSELDGADAATLPAARARASAFALRAATTLVVTNGARAVLLDEHAQRLAREALFLLVFGSRSSIRSALLERLAADADAGASS